MKKLLFIISAAAMFVACEETFPEREPSPADVAGSQNIRFADYTLSRPLSVGNKTLNIAVVRDVSAQSTTIDVESKIDPMTKGSIIVPTQLTFNTGQDTAYLAVEVDGIEPFIDHKVQIRLLLAADQVLYYAANARPAELTVNISTNDYVPLGNYDLDGMAFVETLLFYHSPSLGNYQIPNYLNDGYNFELIKAKGLDNKLQVKGQDAGDYIAWHTGQVFDEGEIIAHYPKHYEGDTYYNAVIEDDGSIVMVGVKYYLGGEVLVEGYDDTFYPTEE